MLTIQHCPTADTTYTCDLESPGQTPLRVPVCVTTIQGTWGSRSCWLSSCLSRRLFLGLSPHWAMGPGSRASTAFYLREGSGQTAVVEPSPTHHSSNGDTPCPENSSAIARNVTRAGHVAHTPCPANGTGMVKRTHGPDGAWRPARSSCTGVGLLALLQRAPVRLLALLPTCHTLHDLPRSHSGSGSRIRPVQRLFSFSELGL